MIKKEIEYRTEKEISYYEQAQKRSFFEKLIKIKITVLLLLAYICPLPKLTIFLHRLRGVNIGKGCHIGLFCYIDNLYPEYIYIEDEVSINAGSMLIAHFNPLLRHKGVLQAKVSPIIIKKGAIIALKSIILPGVYIGADSIVSAGSVVSDDVESNTLVRGNPAKKVGKIKYQI